MTRAVTGSKTFLASNQSAKLATERVINSDISPLSRSLELSLLILPSFRATNICCLLGETNKAHWRWPAGLSWRTGPCLARSLHSRQMGKGQLNTYMAAETGVVSAAKPGLAAGWHRG